MGMNQSCRKLVTLRISLIKYDKTVSLLMHEKLIHCWNPFGVSNNDLAVKLRMQQGFNAKGRPIVNSIRTCLEMLIELRDLDYAPWPILESSIWVSGDSWRFQARFLRFGRFNHGGLGDATSVEIIFCPLHTWEIICPFYSTSVLPALFRTF